MTARDSHRGILNGAPGVQLGMMPDKEKYKEYAHKAKALAATELTDSLTPGRHLHNLADYLLIPFDNASTYKSSDSAGQFVTTYSLANAGTRRVGLGLPIKHHTFSEFADHAKRKHDASQHCDLVFLRGVPSSLWLSVVGYHLQLPYEFLNQHLDFRSHVGRHNYFPYPILTSGSEAFTRLCFTTIGGANRLGRNVSNADVKKLRKKNQKSMVKYTEALSTFNKMPVCSPIVRHFATLDEQNFSFEQDISILVRSVSKPGSNGDLVDRGWNIVIWTDSGEPVGEGETSWLKNPLQSEDDEEQFPIIMPVRNDDPTDEDTGRTYDASPMASAPVVHALYGRTLDPKLAALDSFYALNELFQLSAHSTSQLLNMLEVKIGREIDVDRLEMDMSPSLASLTCCMRILERHIIKIQESLSTIKGRDSGIWPRNETVVKHGNDMEKKANSEASKLESQYEQLLQRAKALLQTCERGMQVIMQYAMMRETQKAIEQADGVMWLTRLAFIFIPLSYISGVFGMNVREYGRDGVHIWYWVCTSVPVFVVSIILSSRKLRGLFGTGLSHVRPSGKLQSPSRHDSGLSA